MEAAIAELLNDLSAVQDDLIALLLEKHRYLAAGDMPGIESLKPRQEVLAQRLQQSHARRAELLAQASEHGYPADSVGALAAGIIPAPRQSEIKKRMQESAMKMRILQHHSLSAWVLAQKSILHLSQLLEIIATGGRTQPTYGNRTTPHESGALLDQAA